MNKTIWVTRVCRPVMWGALVTMMLMSAVASAQQVDWMRRFDVAGANDGASGVAMDSTGVYVTGGARVAAPGSTGDGLDGYVRKYGFGGKVLWSRQFRIGTRTEPFAIAVDSQGIYLTGRTDGGAYGAFVSRLDLEGNVIWSHVLDYRKMTQGMAIAVHSTGIYVGGDVLGVDSDAVLARLDFAGNELWTTPRGIGTTQDDKFLAVTADDTGIYGAGIIGGADIRKFNFDGQEVMRFGSGDFEGSAVAQDGTGIYAAGVGISDTLGAQIRKYDRSGALSWRTTLDSAAAAIALDERGIYVVLPNSYGEQPQVAKYTLAGDFIWQGALGERLSAHACVVRDGYVYVAGAAFGDTETGANSFIARFSPARAPQLLSIGRLEGSPGLATLIHDPAVPSVEAHVRNAATGEFVSRVRFPAQYHPQDLSVIPDRNGNGAPELVLLGIHETTGNVMTQIRDSRSGALLTGIWFDKTHVPRRLAVVPDVGSTGHPGVAVLGVSRVDRGLRLEIKDSVTRDMVQSIDFSPWRIEQSSLDLRVLPDSDGNGGPEIAVLVIAPPLNRSLVVVKDALSGRLLSEAFFESRHCPRDFVAVPDVDGNGSVELAVLLQGCWSTQDRVQVDLRDSLSGARSGLLGYARFTRPVALMLLPDFDGNRGLELGVLALNVRPDKDVLSVKDISTNLWTHSISFLHEGYRHRDAVVLPDVSGNGFPEVAQLQERRGDGKLRVFIKDARTGAFVRVLN